MHAESRAEEKANSGGGGEGGHRQEFQRLCPPLEMVTSFKYLGGGDLGGVSRLAGGGKGLVLDKKFL